MHGTAIPHQTWVFSRLTRRLLPAIQGLLSTRNVGSVAVELCFHFVILSELK